MLYYLLGLVLDSGTKWCPKKKKKKKIHSPFPPELLPLKPLRGVLLPPAYFHSKPSFSSSITDYFVERSEELILQGFLPWAKPARAWWFGAPQGYPFSPTPAQWWIPAPAGQSEAGSSTLSSLHDRLYHVLWTFLILRRQGEGRLLPLEALLLVADIVSRRVLTGEET